MSRKSFIIILGLSIILWYISKIVQALIEMFVFNIPSISIYPTSNVETGYPIFLNLSRSDSMRYVFYLINITFWFMVIWGIWKIFFKNSGFKKKRSR